MAALGQSSKRIRVLQRECQVTIPLHAKQASVQKLVFAGLSTARDVPRLLFDRFQARRFYSNPRNPADSLLGQFVSATNRDTLELMKRNGVPWNVQLAIERPIDAGGPGRELFSEVCMEVMRPELGLFVPTPNHKLKESVANQDVLVPNPAPFPPGSLRAQMYFYTGALIGLCYICTSPCPFRFAPFVWSYLCEDDVTIEHIYEIDERFRSWMRAIETPGPLLADPDAFGNLFSGRFEIGNAVGEMVELRPNGRGIVVTEALRPGFVEMCRAYRLREFDEQLKVIKEGFNYVFPSRAAGLLSPVELAFLCCGSDSCPVEEMKKWVSVSGDSEGQSAMFWRVMEGFSPDERRAIIKFACGRVGLPPPGGSWPSKISLSFSSRTNVREGHERLPTAGTCSWSMYIPYYPTQNIMAAKLRTACSTGGLLNDGAAMDWSMID
jgi:hypothetical protein